MPTNMGGGKRVATGSLVVPVNTTTFTISGLLFTPKYIHFSGNTSNGFTMHFDPKLAPSGTTQQYVGVSGLLATPTVTFNANSVTITNLYSIGAASYSLYYTVTN